MPWKRFSVLTLAAVLASMSSSCGKKIVLTDIEEGLMTAGAGVEAAATLIDDPEVFKSLLKCYPPDSGVVPVYVTVKNIDSRPVELHNLNYLPLSDAFRGFQLELGGDLLDPIHPIEAVMYIKGKAEIPDYKEIRAGHVVTGMIVWPLGIYYIFTGVQYSRQYRPLLRNSFFPAGRGGYFDPVTLEPGEARSGFIYFALKPEDNPYYRDYGDPEVDRRGKEKPSLKVGSGEGLRIIVNPAVRPPSYGDCETPVDPGLTVTGLKPLRAGDGSPQSGAGGPSPWDFFALTADESRGTKLDLVIGSSAGLFESRSTEGIKALAELAGKEAELADASRWGDKAVCGVNFKQRSRLYLVGLAGGEAVLKDEAQLDRKISRVIAAEDAVYVITDNEFCYTFEYKGLRTKRYVNMGDDVEDVVMAGGRLLTFGKKEAAEYAVRPGHNPQRLRSVEVSPSRKAGACLAGDRLVVIHGGKGTRGDTLVTYDPVSLAETARQPFPGRLDIIEASPDAVVVQMTGGTVMKLSLGEGGEISDAGWVPVLAQSACMSGDIITLVSEDRRLYSFRIESIVPRPLSGGGAVSVSPGVGTPYGEVPVKEKRKR